MSNPLKLPDPRLETHERITPHPLDLFPHFEETMQAAYKFILWQIQFESYIERTCGAMELMTMEVLP